MADVKWIKLSTDLFSNRKIKQIERMPDGDALIVVWLKLLTLAGTVNDSGLVYFTRDIPYTEQLLANEFNRPVATIEMALRVFEQFGMIEIVDNLIHVSNWEKYQNVEGMEKIRKQNRLRVQRFRDKQKEFQELPEPNVTGNVTVTLRNAIDIDKKEDKELDKNKKTNSRFAPPTVEQVKAYCLERGNSVDAETFVDFYTAKGWKVGRDTMKDWKACVRTWEKRDNKPKGLAATSNEYTTLTAEQRKKLLKGSK